MAVGVATIFWQICKTRNSAYFGKVFPYDPNCVVVKASHSLSNWSEL